jgi:hypothetical protein
MSERKEIKVIKRDEKPMNEDVKRLCISLINVLKREFPKDWRRIMEDLSSKAA